MNKFLRKIKFDWIKKRIMEVLRIINKIKRKPPSNQNDAQNLSIKFS